MRVLLDMTAAPAQLAGAGHYMERLARAVVESGQVELHLACRAVHAARLEDVGAELHVGGSDRRPLRLAWEQTGLVRLARRLRPDVLHSPHYTLPLRAPGPVVVTCHDATFFTHPKLHQPGKVWFFRAAMRVAARRARRIIAVSEATRAGVLGHTGAAPHRIDVVPEGVDHAEFHPPSAEEAEAFRAQHALAQDRPYVAFLGTLEPRKNLARLVEAFARLAADWPGDLLIAGQNGWGPLPPEHPRVRRLGYLDDGERRAYLGGAAAFAYPSLAEGFGLPVLEAMACGTPVVTAAGSATEEVAGGAAELADPTDARAIEAALRRVLLEASHAAARRAAGLERAAAFTWAAAAAGTVASYRAAAGAGNLPAS